MTGPDLVVVGGGAIGLAVAWRAAASGLDVTVCDDDPGRGASWVAAGMLAPVTEAHYGEEALVGLHLAAVARWPSFAAELAEATGHDVGLRTDGTLAVALDDDDLCALEDLARFQRSLGLDAERLRARECRQLEPLLHPRVRGGLFAPGDHQVDTRRLVRALLVAVERAGVGVVRQRVAGIDVGTGTGRRVTGVRLCDGTPIATSTVVLTAGSWSGRIAGIPSDAVPPVRPVKGQILRLGTGTRGPQLARSVRGLAKGRSVYLVPRAGGELVIGATVEEQGYDTTVTAGAALELLAAAVDVVPGVAEAELVEARAGLRPGTPDNAPVLGPSPVDGLVLATGHYRNGILLTPVTADAVIAFMADGALPSVAAPFTLARFAS